MLVSLDEELLLLWYPCCCPGEEAIKGHGNDNHCIELRQSGKLSQLEDRMMLALRRCTLRNNQGALTPIVIYKSRQSFLKVASL